MQKADLLEIIHCPTCSGSYKDEGGYLICNLCHKKVPLINGIPVFSEIPSNINPSEKRNRAPEINTPWRNANTRFLVDQVKNFSSNTIVLDIGAGRGDFSEIFINQRYFAMDIYPYPEIDLVCDLSNIKPFIPNSIDVILLMNVLEHLPEAASTLKSLELLLRPGGIILVSVPFLVKIHQSPYDFARYTHFFLEKIGSEAGLAIDLLEGYFDPAFLVSESERYIRFWSLPRYSFFKRRFIMLALIGLRFFQFLLSKLLGPGYTKDIGSEKNPAPVGYHIIYKKND